LEGSALIPGPQLAVVAVTIRTVVAGGEATDYVELFNADEVSLHG
jgi:hypothetical protein